jgi:hypothetical protein
MYVAAIACVVGDTMTIIAMRAFEIANVCNLKGDVSGPFQDILTGQHTLGGTGNDGFGQDLLLTESPINGITGDP